MVQHLKLLGYYIAVTPKGFLSNNLASTLTNAPTIKRILFKKVYGKPGDLVWLHSTVVDKGKHKLNHQWMTI